MSPEKDRFCRKIYEENSKLLYQYIYRKVGDGADTDDILQEVFIALLFHLDEFLADYPDNSKRIRAWLFGVANNKVLHFWRENQKILRMEISTELVPELSDPQSILRKEDCPLPDWVTPMDKKLLFLKYSGYSLKEIGANLGLSYGACRMRSSRLMKELKKFFET